ncbi:hypothetical protein E3T43_15880 [Cryobacterium sp. Hh7]|uniref:polysaccharide biosynthesis C-terminal domain-containing protein n=1 Tax=Cryobacterium sp. Hh7 TaxID=1259159 RepID=UPI00106CD81C|nr:polysaccharide biosynthesis C-terminal domain-containing protein [Cryobacterium sp. Hh7]TFD51764.1 hypothetical protein E3T43_15880 [Cryobacterium sp. Hh7]
MGLTAIVTLVAIPIMISHSGAHAWASIALGQAIGTGCAVLIGFGWGTTGPTQVAMARGLARIHIYTDSLQVRSFLAIPGVVFAVGLAFLFADTYREEAALTAAAFAMNGLLAGWFFTGSARPYSFLLLDTAPRVIGTVAGAIALLLGASLVFFPLLQLVGITLGVVLSTVKVGGWANSHWNRLSRRRVSALLKGQSHGMVIAGVSAAFITVPISIVALVAPAALPAYALADKILRFSTTAFSPVVQFLQGWVPGTDDPAVTRRIRWAFAGGLLLTVTAGTVFTVGLPWFAGVLSSGEIIPAFGLSLAFGLILVLLVMAQVTGLVCLLALERAQNLALFTIIGAAVGIPAVFLGVSFFGAQGAAWALVFAEFVALAPQIVLLGRLLNYRSSGRPPD